MGEWGGEGRKKECFGVGVCMCVCFVYVHIPKRGVTRWSKEQWLGAGFGAKRDHFWAQKDPVCAKKHEKWAKMLQHWGGKFNHTSVFYILGGVC